MPLKVMTVVGTRPEVIKLSRVIPELDKHFEHVLVHTGQNYAHNLNDVFFEEMQIRKPDEQLTIKPGSSPIAGISEMLYSVNVSLERYQPDALLILGDTNSCVAAAYAAKRRKVPIFHMEAGNRCFDQRTPEEINRKIVDHLADINMVYTEHARRNLEREGLHPQTIIKTGSPMEEVIDYYAPQIDQSAIQRTLGVYDKQYFVVSVHREENVDDPARLGKLLGLLNSLRERYSVPVVFPVHPRTRERLDKFTHGIIPAVRSIDGSIMIAPLGFIDYAALQRNALCVLSDSGTLTEEAAMLWFPAVMLRQSHERPEGMDVGTTIMCDLAAPNICGAVEMAMTQSCGYIPEDYQAHGIARKVARTILSYTDFVNRTVWHK